MTKEKSLDYIFGELDIGPVSSPFCLSPPGSTASVADDSSSEVDSRDNMASQSSCEHLLM